MTEQKPKGFGFFMNKAKTKQEKSFGLIVKSAKTKQQTEEKKLYTIVSCCVSAIFLITIIVPLLSSGEDKTSGNSYKSIAFDLADLAVDDEAEKVLLEMQKYSDIPTQKIAGGLFDKKDKEKRQETDKKEGIPAAPDTEYKQARKRKQAKSSGVSKPIYTAKARPTTTTGSLTRSNTISGGSGSSGVSTSIWRSDDKSKQQSGQKSNTGNIGTQQLVAATGARNKKATAFVHAVEESQKGANSQNADTAAQAAADAFTNNNVEAEEDDLKDGMDELAEQFNADEFKKATNNNELTDLKNELDKENEDKKDEADPCKSRNKAIRMECRREQFLEKMMEKLIDAAVDIATSYATGEVSGRNSEDKLDDLKARWESAGSESEKTRLNKRIERMGKRIYGKSWNSTDYLAGD